MTTASPPIEEIWKLEDLFDDDDAFERERASFESEVLPSLEQYRGRLFVSPSSLGDALEAVAGASRILKRLHCYAALKADVDTRQAADQARRERVGLLSTRFAERIAFLRPEILAQEPLHLDPLFQTDARLSAHAHFLQDVVRQRDHVLQPEEERIIAEAGLLRHEAASLYQLFVNAELPRSEYTLSTGETIRLTPVTFQEHRSTRHRDDRHEIFRHYFSAYQNFQRTLGQNLNSILKSHLFRARVRHFDSCVDAALFPDHVPVAVYRNLIRQVHAHLPLLHRYFDLKRRALGLDTLEYPDVYASIGQTTPRRYTAAESRTAITDALAPLGPSYAESLRAAFVARWIDWHPSPGKRSGAYATGWGYDVHPYVLLNFTGNHDAVMTLAHELGHAMHSHFSNRDQPFATADYAIFVAEVASTFNEALLARHLRESAATSDERAFLLASQLDGLRGTLFRQTMFAEFELDIHERAERGEVLTGDGLNEIYLALLRRYHGHDDGVVIVDERYAVEWAAIPHFYFDFYVYQYATGIVAATALARGVAEGRPGALDRYLTFLSSGGSDYPLELLRAAGVDLESPEPYREAFAAMDGQLRALAGAIDSHP